jgi:hypothetical protein
MLVAASPRVIAQTPVASAPVAEEPQDISEHEGRLVHSVRAYLVAEQFDELDRLADQFRRDRERWPGGQWKLHTLYEALDAPHQTDKDSVEHLEHLRHWMAQRPESITARVALATSLKRWAWVARGNGLANTVSEEQWALFNQRIAEAQVVLEGSRDMKVMCPQWYEERMAVGLAQGWDGRQMQELFDRAVQFEPEYQFFYKSRTNYLLPKWYGGPDDAVKFAKKQADRLGGDRGDYMYYEMATVIVKKGNGNLEKFLPGMDWGRIQRGYQALAARFGVNRGEKNQLAFMAWQFKDKGVAQQQFASIGQDWSEGVWRDRKLFDRARDWADGHTSWP